MNKPDQCKAACLPFRDFVLPPIFSKVVPTSNSTARAEILAIKYYLPQIIALGVMTYFNYSMS